jgi:hypothetical protein
LCNTIVIDSNFIKFSQIVLHSRGNLFVAVGDPELRNKLPCRSDNCLLSELYNLPVVLRLLWRDNIIESLGFHRGGSEMFSSAI